MNNYENENKNNDGGIDNNKEKKIYDAITDVSDSLIDEAKKTRLKKFFRSPKILSVIAACAVCAITVPVVMNMIKEPVPVVQTDDIVTEKEVVTERTEPITETNLLLDEQENGLLLTSVIPSKISGRVIETDSSFALTTAAEVEASELKSLITLEPDIPFEINKTEEKSFYLNCSETLPSGSVVKLSLLDEYGGASKSWAFQTSDTYRITSTMPYNEGMYVPVDTGIEITFSQITEVSEIENYFEIVPEVSGRFERHRSTVVFVPDEELLYNTVYTVKVKSGLTSADGYVLDGDLIFKFKTSNTPNNLYIYMSNGISETFLPSDMAVIEFFSSREFHDASYDVKLYRYDGEADYLGALKGYSQNKSWQEDYVFSSANLELIYSSEEKQIRHPDAYEWNSGFLTLPEELEQGYYLVDIKTKYDETEYSMQKLVQINPISVYSSVLTEQAAFFVNSAETGEVAANAVISLEINGVSEQKAADSSGIAFLDIKAENYGTGILRIEYNGSVYLDLFDYRSPDSYDPLEDYYLYLYTDREIYLTSDKVNVWGVVLPRSDRAVMPPPDLNLTLGNTGFGENNGTSVPVTLKGDGTFTASLSYENHVEEWWTFVTLTSGESKLCAKSIVIKDYVKPTYVIETETPVYAWMPQENPAGVSLQASFFDGTPAKGLQFNVNYDFTNTVTTDKDGNALANVTADDYSTWSPVKITTAFQLAGTQNEYQAVNDDFYALFRDIMLEYEISGNAVSFRTSLVDTGRINQESDLDWDKYADTLRGEPVSINVKGILTHIWDEKIEKGSFYDFIQKKNVKTYEYRNRRDIAGTYETVTSDGVGEFLNLPINTEEGYYILEINYYDTNNRFVSETKYIFNRNYYGKEGVHYYSFSNKDDNYSFTENQKTDFYLTDRGIKAGEADGRIFYAFSRYGFITAGIEEKTSFSHIMGKEYIPDVYVSGAYFDGKHVYPISPALYSFYPKEREIKFNIETDKDKYAPAENVNINIHAADINGNPLQNASVSLSLVDEAIFAIKDQNADPLGTLYTQTNIPWVSSYYSYIQHVLGIDSGSEKGGGGGNTQVRRDLEDTAAFLTGTTNINGNISFSFKLPDNLTSWRATIQAIGTDSEKRLYSGAVKTPVISTLPFFIVPVVLPQYVEGDDFSVSANIIGETADNAKLTASLTGVDFDMTVEGKSGEALMFGKLPKGEYKILFEATDGTNSDAIELNVEVKETLLESFASREFNLSDGMPGILPSRYPVTLVFSDNEYRLYGKVLDNLLSIRGERADLRIANMYAQLELGYVNGEDYKKALTDITMSDIVKLFPYSEPDIKLTSLICAAAPDLLNTNLTADALYSQLNQSGITSETLTSCLMGLAALSKPVITDIYDLLDNPDGLGYQDKLRLCVALALVGDCEGAEKYYIELTSKNAVSYTDSDSGEYTAYLKSDGLENSISDTALALLTASVLNLPETGGMAKYLIENKSAEQTTALELMIYLRRYTPKKPGEAVFTYNLNGKTETVKLKRFSGLTMRFGKEQLESADFKTVSGDVSCTAYYIGSLGEQQKQPVLTVNKEIVTIENNINIGGLMKVTLSIPANSTKGYYCFEDVIPSGARYSGTPDGFYAERSGQRVGMGLYFDPSFSSKNFVVYYIRLATAGEYVAESAVVRDSEGNWGKTERGTLLIKP